LDIILKWTNSVYGAESYLRSQQLLSHSKNVPDVHNFKNVLFERITSFVFTDVGIRFFDKTANGTQDALTETNLATVP
jgi:hypothetical protein